jgi:hypothetical protein
MYIYIYNVCIYIMYVYIECMYVYIYIMCIYIYVYIYVQYIVEEVYNPTCICVGCPTLYVLQDSLSSLGLHYFFREVGFPFSKLYPLVNIEKAAEHGH